MAVGNMKIYVRLRYIFSFGKKVSGFNCQGRKTWRAETWNL